MLQALRHPAVSSCLGHLALAVGPILCLLVGCGESNSKVSGVVTLDRRPLHWGTVSFYDASGGIHRAEIDSKGRYEISSVSARTARLRDQHEAVSPGQGCQARGDIRAVEGKSAKTLTEGTISEEQLRAVFGPTLEEQKPRKPNPGSGKADEKTGPEGRRSVAYPDAVRGYHVVGIGLHRTSTSTSTTSISRNNGNSRRSSPAKRTPALEKTGLLGPLLTRPAT